MSKRQKLSFFPLEGLPDEIILKILSLLDIEEVLLCGKVSKRLRVISNDQSLWLKLNLFGREAGLPYGLIQKAVKNGCEYLNLSFNFITGGKKSEVPWKLKYLDISKPAYADDFEWAMEAPKGVLENCHSLQKLAVDNLILNPCEIEQICQNGETLRILRLEGCKIVKEKLIQELFTKCPQLTELNIGDSNNLKYQMSDPHLCALVNNLTPNILKLHLSCQQCFQDKHLNTLVERCKKITELELTFTSITNESMKSIIKHLNNLEKLDVSYTKIDFSTLLQLKSIPTLKILGCFGTKWEKDVIEKTKNLKLQLPHISINEKLLHIASLGDRRSCGSINPDWF